MAIYDKPTKTLLAEWAESNLKQGQTFSKEQPVGWFQENYPKIKKITVQMHVEGMCINNSTRKHHPSIRPGSGHDLFFKIGANQYRLRNLDSDPQPRYKDDFDAPSSGDEQLETDDYEDEKPIGSEFAFERDLQNFLTKNLHLIESGLKVYDDDGISGIEFPAGGRRIDILAVGSDGKFVVIELKVSRGYDRVIGQILRYMSWIDANMGSDQPSRGIIVAKEITPDLKLAASRIREIQLVEYDIKFSIRSVEAT